MADKILATVNGIAIHESELDALIASLGQRGAQYNNLQGRAMLLDQLINHRLFLIDAQRNLLEAEAAFQAQLKAAKESLLAEYAVGKVLSSVSVTEEEARKYYDDNKDKFVTGESVNASHILVASKDEAEKILADIKSGTVTFEDAARQHSTCPSGKNGGSLGDFSKGQMVPEFEKAAFSMNDGEISGPVKTDFGFHIIRLNSKNPSRTVPYSEIREEIKADLLAQKQKKAYDSKINMLKIVYPVDKF